MNKNTQSKKNPKLKEKNLEGSRWDHDGYD